MNTRVDSYAKSALVEAVISRKFISDRFPFEPIRIYAGTKKLTGSRWPFITNHNSRKIAKIAYGFSKRGKKLLDEEDFDLVYCDIIPRALKEFPSSFKDWLSKHVQGAVE